MLDKFLRKKKAARNDLVKYQDVYHYNQGKLQAYVATGKVESAVALPNGWFPWEQLHVLTIPEFNWVKAAEVTFIQSARVDYPLLMRSLAYGYIQTALDYYQLHHFFARFGREMDGAIAAHSIFRLCLAELAGLDKEARQLYQVFSTGYKRDWFIRSNSHIGDVLLLIYSRYLEKRHLEKKRLENLDLEKRGLERPEYGETLEPRVDDFSYPDVLAHWDSTDLKQVTAVLQRLCDEQVAQAASPPSKFFTEFKTGNWCYIPYSALFVLKLRQNLGLANPSFSHPGFGELTALMPTGPMNMMVDEFLEGALTRLRSQGFDEQAFFALRR
ncbi:hypothetical protein ACRWQN_11365 [Shewanella sp. HL-SH8]|uniref:hypothetical protein n=1 Tax=Shewanella sp. HL-SH8 TaxID=3436242 RepID=UPI003EBCFD55